MPKFNKKQQHRRPDDDPDIDIDSDNDTYEEFRPIAKQYVPSEPESEPEPRPELDSWEAQFVEHVSKQHMLDEFGNTIVYHRPKPLLILCLEALLDTA